MKFILREPLLHFLVLASGLFFLHSAVSHDDKNTDTKRIVVDEANLLTFIQYRTKSFEPVTAKKQLDSLSEEALEKVIDEYVHEEALYREARALGLDRDDYVIKRRLVQKIDYVARGFAESFGDVTEEDIRSYFDENRADYYMEPQITLTHVFFSSDGRGNGEARAIAKQKLAELKRQNASFSDAPKHGERFLYGVNFIERSQLLLKSQFGPEMTEAIFDLPAGKGSWHGPFMSPHGAHLVMIAQKQAGRMPMLAEVRARVAQAAGRALTLQRTRDASRRIIENYEVDVVYERSGSKLARVDR